MQSKSNTLKAQIMPKLEQLWLLISSSFLPLVRQLIYPLLGQLYVYYTQYVPLRIRFIVDWTSSFFMSLLRMGVGSYAISKTPNAKVAQKPLILYEFEACPFCRKVREVCSMLDLDVLVYPCPRVTMKQYGVVEGSRYRPKVMEIGGKAQFPLLIDENTGVKMYESMDIIKYLYTTYGGISNMTMNDLPWLLRPSNITNRLSFLGTFSRPLVSMGMLRCPSKVNQQPIELFGFEADPSSRLIRETLTCLELTYLLHNVPFGSSKRKNIQHSIPTLIDPNTSFKSSNTDEIRQYLFQTYQDGPFPKESWLDYSTKGASVSHGTAPGVKRD